MKPLIAITMGDPAGIGPEVVCKALSSPLVSRFCRPVIIGDVAVLRQHMRSLKLRPRIHLITAPEEVNTSEMRLNIINLKSIRLPRLKMGRPNAESGRAAVKFIQVATQLALDQRLSAIVTAPISKEAIRAAGYSYPGHTELLADLSGNPEVGMLLVAPLPFGTRQRPTRHLRILLATTHLSLRDCPRYLTRRHLQTSIRLAHETAVRYFGLPRPRIAVAGLNPHAGEGGLFGREEIAVIRPAIAHAQRNGIPVTGPWPADTLIRRAFEGKVDMVVAMYHDQALIPIKLLGFGRSVNITVGLPFIRTSVDHGTATDIAGQGIADPGSLLEAIRLAAQMAAVKTT